MPSMYGLSSSIAASPDPAAASPSEASAKNGPTQNSAWNGPAALAFTDATRLYSACTLPRTSPAMRIFFAFGSDIAPYQTLRTPEGVIGQDCRAREKSRALQRLTDRTRPENTGGRLDGLVVQRSQRCLRMFVPSAPRGPPVVRRAKHATRLRNRRSRRGDARCGHGRLVRRFGASPTVVSLADRVSNDSFPHPSFRAFRAHECRGPPLARGAPRPSDLHRARLTPASRLPLHHGNSAPRTRRSPPRRETAAVPTLLASRRVPRPRRPWIR